MALILALETTTTNCSVALGLDGKCIAIKELNAKQYSHSEKLHLFIQSVLAEQHYSIAQLDAVAVSQGPGSYTGLRIGVSAAKGLCFSADIPLIAIDTLTLLAAQATDKTYQHIVPMLDARRMEVYTALFDGNAQKLTPTEAKILDEEAYADILAKGKTLFIGNGAEKFNQICQHPEADFREAYPSAREMLSLAEEKYQKSDTVDVAYFEPYYLKDFIAKKPNQK